MASQRQLRILSLDGGGLRGLSSLIILRSIMRKLETAKPLQEKGQDEPRPCDYFDYIIGTGIGGVIALLLGRLQLTVSQCMIEYRKISSLVGHNGYSPLHINNCYSPLFDMEKLLHVAKEIVEKYDKDRPWLQAQNNTAKTIVFAVEKDKGPFPIETTNSKDSALNPETTPLIEVFAALMAAKGLFEEFSMKNRHGNIVTFLDKPYPWGFSNPIPEALERISKENGKQFDATRPRNSLVVSIGTGQVAETDIRDLAFLAEAHDVNLFGLLKPWTSFSILQMVREVNNIVPEVAVSELSYEKTRVIRRAGHECQLRRFEIGPVPDVGPNDFRSVGEVEKETKIYLDEKGREAEKVAEELSV